MKSYILLLGLLLGGFTAYADSTAKKETEAILIGHVVDSRSGEHLPFITITVKGTTIGTTTDVSGHYLLGNLPVGRPLTVVAQSVGYKSAERSVTLGAHSTTELNFELEEQAAITLSAGKENFNGEFSVKPEITGGDGYLIIDGRNYHTADRFSLQADTPCQILYQPLTSGSHEIRFILSDGICSAEEAVTVEVFNQGGVVKPQNGIYIYTTEGLYFSAARWEKLADKDAFSPEGVAIITDEAKFLLAPERDAGFWGNSYIGPHDQYISLLPDIPWIKDRDEAAKDFDGRKNTEALIRAYEDGRLNQANAARFCYYYEPDEPGKWYLPAAGQMNLVTEHVAEIQKCLELIGGQKFIYEYMDYHYASSTGCDNLSIWCMCFFTSTAPAFNHYAKIASPVKYYPVRDL